MALNTMLGFVRRLTGVGNYAEGDEKAPHVNSRGDMCAAQALPERSEVVRLGNSWGIAIPTGSAFTFVAAWPTTRAELVLSNGEAAGGKSYIIDRVWMTNITSQAAAQPFTMLGQINPASNAIATGTDNTAVLRYPLCGTTSVYGGLGKRLVANTAFALTNLWFSLGVAAVSPMTTNLGNTAEAFCYGRYIIPPGAQFCVAGLAGTAAGTAIAGIEYHEVQLPMS